MPLIIPAPQASLRPFFTEVQRYLLDEMANTNIARRNSKFRAHINLVRNFARTIDPAVFTIETLLRGLSQAGQFDSENIAIYRDCILDGLRRYLTRVDQDGDNALMISTCYHPEAVQPLLAAIPDENTRRRVFEQVNQVGNNALILAATNYPEAVQPLLDAMPAASKRTVFEQVNQYRNNALMLAARYHPNAVQPLLAAMPEASKQRVFEQVNHDGWNALMRAAHYQPEAVKPMLDAMPEVSKQRVFEQVNHDGYNVLMIAARLHPEVVQPLLEAMPEASKQRVFEQMNQYDNNALVIAAYNQPTAVQPLLAAMPRALKQQTFQRENNQWFTFGPGIIQNLFAHNHVHFMLTLLQEGVLPLNGNVFKEIVAHKRQLLDYILSLGEEVRYRLLTDIHNNTQDSPLAKIFHTSRGILKPKINRGLLGLAENEYLRLHQNAVINSKSMVDLPFNPELPLIALNTLKTLSDQVMYPTFGERLISIGFKEEIPHRFTCHITKQIMNKPILFSDGHHYDMKAIETRISQNTQLLKSPLTNKILSSAQCMVDYDLNLEIDNFVLYQERRYAENQRLKPSAPSYEEFNATISTAASSAQDSADNHDIPSLYPTLAQSFESDYCKPAYKMPSLNPQSFFAQNKASSSVSPYTAVLASERPEGTSQLIDLSAILTGGVESKSESNPVFFNRTPLTPIPFVTQNEASSFTSPQENNQALSEWELRKLIIASMPRAPTTPFERAPTREIMVEETEVLGMGIYTLHT